MADTRIQLRRMATAARVGKLLAPGEPCWDVTEQRLYIGDGVTLGGVAVGGGEGGVLTGGMQTLISSLGLRVPVDSWKYNYDTGQIIEGVDVGAPDNPLDLVLPYNIEKLHTNPDDGKENWYVVSSEYIIRFIDPRLETDPTDEGYIGWVQSIVSLMGGITSSGALKCYKEPETAEFTDFALYSLDALLREVIAERVKARLNITVGSPENPAGSSLSFGIMGSVNGEYGLFSEDCHALGTVYGSEGIVVGRGRQNHSHDGSIWIASKGVNTTDGGPGQGAPKPGSQETRVYTDESGTHFQNNHAFEQGSESTAFHFDDAVHATAFVGDGSGLTGIIGEQGETGPQGIQGEQGPQGETGPAGADADLTTALGVVAHGATAGTARPSGYTVVQWIGTVDPTNKVSGDLWLDVS